MIEVSENVKNKITLSRGASGYTTADFSRINIIPTYRAVNINNSNIPGFWSNRFSGDLKIENFYWVVDRLMNTQGLKSIAFMGGEPMLWDKIEDAISYLKKNKIKIILNTNCFTHKKKSIPDRVIVNLHTYIDIPSLRESIQKSLEFYRDQRLEIDLRLYSRINERQESLILVGELTKKIGLKFSIYPTFLDKKLNCRNCIYSGLTIQPDGDTVTLCKFLPCSGRLSDHLSIREIYESKLVPGIIRHNKCLADSTFFS